MTLLRFAGRALFSAYFISEGYKSLTKPAAHIAEVQRSVDAVLPLAKNFLPEEVAAKIPSDPRTWTRLLGGVQLAAGVGYTLNVLRRPAAVALTLTTLPKVIGSTPSRGATADERSHERTEFLRNLALLGAAVIASQDTQGRPSLVWQARYGFHNLGTAADHSKHQLAQKARTAQAKLDKGKLAAELAATRKVHQAKDALR